MKAGISEWLQRIFARRGSACCTRTAGASTAQLDLPFEETADTAGNDAGREETPNPQQAGVTK